MNIILTEEQFETLRSKMQLDEVDDKDNISVTAKVGPGGSVASAATKAANVAKAANVNDVNIKMNNANECRMVSVKDFLAEKKQLQESKFATYTLKDILNG